MNLVVFGITWATGLEIVRHALERGHSVTAMVRSPAPPTQRPIGVMVQPLLQTCPTERWT
jgi:putative NADH-flavin reductase